MKVVILAGGSGTRLWPLSRSAYPKQFLRFDDTHSLLQKTVLRFLRDHDVNDLMIVSSQEYYHLVNSQVSCIDQRLEQRIVLEPCKKNTMLAIAWAFKMLEERDNLDQKEPVLICPSDHLIVPEQVFLDRVEEATASAKQGNIVTFGIRPNRPETGYGYIKIRNGQPLEPVEAFVEKPDFETATRYVLSGDFLWNAGIFMLTRESFWREAMRLQSEIGKFSNATLKEFEVAFQALPELSFDYAIMEKTNCAVVMPLELTWSDVGSWDSLYDVLEKDAEDNVALGNVHTIDTYKSLIIGGKRLISTIGLEDTLVIDTEDALFIAKRGESQRVKMLVDVLKAKGSRQVVEHVEVHRPWGSYTILEEGLSYKIKRISVSPLKKLTLQIHAHRSEHWVVLQGTAKITIGEKQILIHENESAFVPKSCSHRLENPGVLPLEIIEVQVGEYLSEDDIFRLEEDYLQTPTEVS